MKLLGGHGGCLANHLDIRPVFGLGVFSMARRHALVSLRHALVSLRHAAPSQRHAVFFFFFRISE